MILTPESREELVAQLARNYSVGGRIEAVELNALASVVEHSPEDMTASVEAGMTLAALQRQLQPAGQWLPIDPPGSESLTIGDLLAFDRFGSRRLGYGRIRDYLIGIKVALADGTLIKAGGKVVKNVAGYDLSKLFIGAQHSLGVIVEATFKLRPLPEIEMCVQREVETLEQLEEIRTCLLSSKVEPVLFDAHHLRGSMSVVAAFAGYREDVAEQVDAARALGFANVEEASGAREFWNGGTPAKASVLPSRTVAVLTEINAPEWLAHLGNGIIFHRGGTPVKGATAHGVMIDRIKAAYDPNGILPHIV